MSNTEYALHLMRHCDILCLQEHWLLNYEKKLIAEIFPEFEHSIKCTDDKHPDLPMQRRRGSGGTAIIWRKSIDHLIEVIPDGSDRVLAAYISLSNLPLLIVNTYMPTMGCKDPEYGETLDEVHELLTKYDDCEIIWTGDLNADLTRDKNYTNDKQLAAFLREQQLVLTPHQDDTPTYHHFNGNTTSRLDMFIERSRNRTIQKVRIDIRHILNTSSHDALTAFLDVTCPVTTQAKKNSNCPPPLQD